MTAPTTGLLAAWATTADVCAPCNAYDFDTDVLEDGLLLGSEVLYHLTRRRWPGSRTDVIRPSSNCSLHTDACQCGAPSQVRLPGYPVASVDEVLVDGAVVAADRYRVDDHRWLVYQPDPAGDALGAWPRTNDLSKPPTEANTWQVTYTWGVDPPATGVQAAASLGCQLALACQPATAGECRLPKRVQTITRQGVSMAILDPLTLFVDGLTGLADVDLWVQATLRGDAQRRATLVVPGSRGARRAT